MKARPLFSVVPPLKPGCGVSRAVRDAKYWMTILVAPRLRWGTQIKIWVVQAPLIGQLPSYVVRSRYLYRAYSPSFAPCWPLI